MSLFIVDNFPHKNKRLWKTCEFCAVWARFCGIFDKKRQVVHSFEHSCNFIVLEKRRFYPHFWGKFPVFWVFFPHFCASCSICSKIIHNSQKCWVDNFHLSTFALFLGDFCPVSIHQMNIFVDTFAGLSTVKDGKRKP